MSKKTETINELLEEAVIPEEEQMFEVPDNWVWTKLNYVADWGSGGTPKSTVPEYYDGKIPWLIIGDLNDGKVDKSAKTISELGLQNSSAKLVEKGSLLIAMYGSIGKLGIANIQCTTNQAIAFTKSYYSNVDRKYLFFYLLSVRNDLLNMGKGGAQQNISLTVLKNVNIPLPPIKQQKKIAEKVERLLRKLDEAKRLIDEVKETYEIRQAAILDKAFRGDLTRAWREGKSDLTDSLELLRLKENSRRKKLAPKDKPNYLIYEFEKCVSKTDKLPSTWVEAPVGFLCDCIVPGRDKPKSFTGDIPWITISDIDQDYINISSAYYYLSKEEIEKVKAKVIPKGSVVMSCVGRFGVSAIANTPLVINQQLHAFLPSEMIDSKYLMYHIRALVSYMNNKATSTTISYLNKTNANSLPISLAPIEEQRKIVQLLDNYFEKNINVKSILESQEKKIEQIKYSILSKAFRGELEIYNESDESAIDLLKSVLQEKLS